LLLPHDIPSPFNRPDVVLTGDAANDVSTAVIAVSMEWFLVVVLVHAIPADQEEVGKRSRNSRMT